MGSDPMGSDPISLKPRRCPATSMRVTSVPCAREAVGINRARHNYPARYAFLHEHARKLCLARFILRLPQGGSQGARHLPRARRTFFREVTAETRVSRGIQQSLELVVGQSLRNAFVFPQ